MRSMDWITPVSHPLVYNKVALKKRELDDVLFIDSVFVTHKYNNTVPVGENQRIDNFELSADFNVPNLDDNLEGERGYALSICDWRDDCSTSFRGRICNHCLEGFGKSGC